MLDAEVAFYYIDMNFFANDKNEIYDELRQAFQNVDLIDLSVEEM